MKKIWVILAAVLFLGMPAAVFGGLAINRGTALVIGNNDYKQLAKLSSAVNDAQSIAATLEKWGFSVDLRLNVNAGEMNRAIDEFAAKLKANPNDEGFFWFAGQGMQLNSEAYMLAVDAGTTETQIKAGAVPVRKLLESLNTAKNKMNTVIIDDCMPPFTQSEPDVAIEPAILGNFTSDICYIRSASPGQAAADSGPGGKNSPFTQAFLHNIQRAEPLQMLVLDIVKETLKKTNGAQKPYYQSYLLNNKTYSLGRSGGSR